MPHYHLVCSHPVTIVKKAELLGVNDDQEASERKESFKKAGKKLLDLESFRSTWKKPCM